MTNRKKAILTQLLTVALPTVQITDDADPGDMYVICATAYDFYQVAAVLGGFGAFFTVSALEEPHHQLSDFHIVISDYQLDV